MTDFHEVLKQYWGYDSFRPLQLNIIQSVANGKDTLGLMPTGGGKSLTFQVPAMAIEGICIVVTPLIALMKDQVQNLKKKNIRAAAIYTGMTHKEIMQTLDNAAFDAYKFLYVSPERLGTAIFQKRIEEMNVSLLAIDEAHCISQWGYDFRPSYLKIAEIREIIPHVPILALTATATPDVVDDIQDKLHFKEKNVFKKSFHRENLAYVVRYTEDKEKELIKILDGVKGTSVVYVRNRKHTKDVATFLQKEGISAEYFHAGLSNDTKDARQNRWKTGETRVIVCTNAFGMGIDKPNVRSVVHLDLPDSLEAYFQEAGRAGRDENKAFAVLLFNKSDEIKLKKRITDSFPDKELITNVYESLGNYFTLAVGYGLDKTYLFDLADFCHVCHFPVLAAYNSIKILQQAGYVELTDEQDSAALVMFIAKKEELYTKKLNEDQDKLIHILLRSYTGLFSDLQAIHEETLCNRLTWKQDKLYKTMVSLSQEHIIKYVPRRKTPFLTFTREREEKKNIFLSKAIYEDKKKKYSERIDTVLNYVKEENVCRNRILLNYFGEKDSENCGACDVCLARKKEDLTNDGFRNIQIKLENILDSAPLTLNEILEKLPLKSDLILQVLRFMQDNKLVKSDNKMKYYLEKK